MRRVGSVVPSTGSQESDESVSRASAAGTGTDTQQDMGNTPTVITDPQAVIQDLLSENARLSARLHEVGEGEWCDADALKYGAVRLVMDDVEEGDWCEVLEDGSADPSCEEESLDEFLTAFKSRVSWLIGLLVLQSCSSFILSDNEELIQRHPSIVYFLTMLVGAGGNAGNQSAVRIIRGLATGSITSTTQWQFLRREVKMAVLISSLITAVGFVRVLLFGTETVDTIAISVALCAIVFISIVAGAGLPLLLERLKLDAAHASTTIQVVMDISGVLITCAVSALLLEGPLSLDHLPLLASSAVSATL